VSSKYDLVARVILTLPLLIEAVHLQAWFTILYSYPLFYQEFNIDLYKNYFINTMANDSAFVTATYAAMVPEPHGPEFEQQDTTKFFQLPIPKAYISLTKDATLSSDYKSWLLFSDRIKAGNNAGVPYQVCDLFPSMQISAHTARRARECPCG